MNKLQDIVGSGVLRMDQNTFCGVRIQQSYAGLFALENILNVFKIKRIVEIGTFHGGLTLFFDMWATANQAQVLSVDVQDKKEKGALLGLAPHQYTTNCVVVDALTKPCREMVANFIFEQRSLTYCDGGDKEKELLMYCELLPPGSVIGCHDYETAAFKKNLGRLFEKDFSELLTDDQRRSLKSHQNFWRKK